MRTYLVFEPAVGGRDAVAADRVVFLREKFRWLALFFAPIWLLWNRLWLGLLLWLAAEIALSMAVYASGIDARLAAPVLWLPTVVVAFESTALLRRKLLRGGFRETGVVVSRDLEEAERRFFAEWSERADSPDRSASEPRSVPPSSPIPDASPGPVIGLFPEPGARR